MTEKKQRKSYTKESFNDLSDTEDISIIEGRNPVIEALRAGVTVDKVYLLDGGSDGPLKTILREIKKNNILHYFVSRDRLDEMSKTGHHQGVIARVAAYNYVDVDDILEKASQKGEAPFIFLLDGIEDPYNLGAIIRTANVSGAHGVIILKRNASGITPTVVKASAGAIEHTPVAKVTNLSKTIDYLKEKGLWFACADMDGDILYDANLTGALGIVIGNEGSGVSRLVRDKCDFIVSIPVMGEISSLNASVAAGVIAYEAVRQRRKA